MEGSRERLKKTFWVIVGGVAISVITALILSIIQDRSPEIIVRQFYNTVEKKAVPKQVGGLIIDYQQETIISQNIYPHTKDFGEGVYLVEVANEGSGPEEALRMQVQFPLNLGITYQEKPDFRVYDAEKIELDENSFFMSLKQFPKNAIAPVSFQFSDKKESLCDVKVTVTGKEKVGRVEDIRGIVCDI